MSEVRNIPILRFPEFQGSWDKKTLGEIGEIVNGITYNPSQIQESGVLVLRSSNVQGGRLSFEDNVFITVDKYNAVKLNDILICVRNGSQRLIGKNAIINKEFDQVGFGAFMTVYRSDFNPFLQHWFQTKDYYKNVHKNLGATINSINGSDLKKFKVPFPKSNEQQKIADFLTAVDKRIELLEKKKTLLETYKKGVMKKIFNQEIRFKDDNGNDFPDWEEYILNDLGDTLNGLTGKTKDDFDKGSSKYIQYKQVFGDSKIDPNGFGLVDVGETEKQTEIKYGDILFTTSSETPNEIGMSSVFMSEIQNVYLNSFCFGFRPKSLENLIPNFSRFLFRSEKVRSSIVKLAQGSTRFNMSKTNFLKIRVRIPSVEEQVKISEFLFSIDNQIELLETQIEKSKTWKKGLLQKMFV